MSRFKVATKLGKYTFSLYCLHNIAVAISKKKKNVLIQAFCF
ncbi:hypothetical protein DK150_550032 [Flavobacterium psychrophilum]|nr:hypothetical protein DK150_550032 [Flavobacterium psychrophilum]SNB08361.1 hypothetical protein JIP1600_1610012 [Flavobacterium psychrophilum]